MLESPGFTAARSHVPSASDHRQLGPGPAGKRIGLSPRSSLLRAKREGIPTMASGTIASLRDRGFGFILPEGGSPHNDLFFHSTAVMDSTFDQLQVGQRVSFDEEPDPRD